MSKANEFILFKLFPSTMFDKLTSRLNQSQRLKRGIEDESIDEDVTQMVEVTWNMSKHPPAELPPAPEGLSTLQVRSHPLADLLPITERLSTLQVRSSFLYIDKDYQLYGQGLSTLQVSININSSDKDYQIYRYELSTLWVTIINTLSTDKDYQLYHGRYIL